MAIIVHHLVNSRSQRILWMLEELGVDYEVAVYQRDSVTNLAPPELSSIHPLGKSPLIEVDGQLIAESGAIIESLCAGFGGEAWTRSRGDADYPAYLEFFHFAEGSAMTPVLMNLYASRLGDAAQPILPRIHQQLQAHNEYMEAALEGTGHFAGSDWSAADVMMSFPTEIAVMGAGDKFPRIADFVSRCHARPAWVRARERGGPYFTF
jgi:glutathione S-transferase